MSTRTHLVDGLFFAVGLLGPAAVTVVLVSGGGHERDYVFIYLGLVAVLGIFRGVWPALLAAATSFLLVDFFFVSPTGTLTIASEEDIVNLVAFLATASIIGALASRRRRAQLAAEALARQLNHLNAELVHLNKQQAEAAQAALRLAISEEQVRTLRETDRLRRELLANVSHELRTPLATILSESTDPSATRSSAPNLARLSTIASEARRLQRLVDDILDMARIEGGALDLELEPLRLADAFASAAERLRRSSPDRKVTWNPEAARIDVLADWDRLGQILDNLLGNADRFGPPETAIECTGEADGPGLVSVRVHDHGPGVAPDLRERIFERFVRGETEADRNGRSGGGLGLAIVKGLVEAHAGTLVYEDGADGATFRITLPRPEESDEPDPSDRG
ncbi:MAG TPA: ATP-binding protein [Candidatus Dormibacteraeota bacterium]|nr:ATP-binding protein [Candidatus Dormibacteraeota bacterium]